MGAQQPSGLNWDADTKYTSSEYGDRGDGTNKWMLWVRAANGAIVPLGISTDAAVAPGANGNIIQLLKGLLGALKAEDGGAADTSLVFPAGVVRRDSPVAEGANGDWSWLHVDALNRLRVVGTHPEDGAHTSGDYGNFILGVGNTGKTAFAANGDYLPIGVGLAGETFMAPVPENNSAWATTPYAAHAAASGVIKASAGKLYKARISNDNAAAQIVMFFNLTAVPADATAPLFAVHVPAKSFLPLTFGDFGRYFSTGICWSNSSTFATKTIGAADCSVSAEYL